MKIAKTLEYSATPEQVFAVLSEQAFQEAKCAATAALKHTAAVTSAGVCTVITTERWMPTDAMPEFARSMIGAELKVRETQEWGPAADDGSRTGTLSMQVSGVPVTVNASLSLAPGGKGTVERIDGDLKAGVPLLGGKIEKAAAPAVEQGIVIEGRTAASWLQR